MTFRLVLASYASAVAMNSFLPANIGTWVMLIMFTTLLAGATFTAMLSGLAVQKIPFSIFNLAVYLYLFLSVSGSFSVKLGFLSDHQGLILLIAIGAVVLIALLVRVFWEKLEGVREQLLAGGAILRSPRKAFVRVLLPELGSYLARLAIVGVFLGAYGIPATFHNIATVTASNSISNSVSATPGGRRRDPGAERDGAQGRDRRGDRHRLLDQPAARDHGLEPGLRRDPRLLGLRLVGRQGPGRVLLRGRQGQEPGDERAAPDEEARAAVARIVSATSCGSSYIGTWPTSSRTRNSAPSTRVAGALFVDREREEPVLRGPGDRHRAGRLQRLQRVPGTISSSAMSQPTCPG